MGELILCRTTLAAIPYFLESIAVNIYSLEELAWCMKQHTELTGFDIYKEAFACWVEEELELKDEGALLHNLLEKKTGMVEFTDTVLKMTAYLEEEKQEQIHCRLKEYEEKSPFEQEIMKADRLLLNGKYKSSIKAYELLTKYRPENKREETMLGRVWHNMGTAYARLFMFARAGECYEKAYAGNREQESAEAALLSHACLEKNFGKEPQDEEFLAKWEKIQERKRAGNMQEYEELLVLMIEQWKQEYRKAAEDK